jgi:hypothetical protein
MNGDDAIFSHSNFVYLGSRLRSSHLIMSMRLLVKAARYLLDTEIQYLHTHIPFEVCIGSGAANEYVCSNFGVIAH